MPLKSNVRGDTALREGIATLRALFPTAVDRALKYEAQDIANDAKDNYVPEAPDGGALKESVRVEYTQRGTGHYAGVRAGGTPETEPYALAVHEHLSPHSPPSWQGKPLLNWTKSGTGPKYLEIPLRNAQANMLGRIGNNIAKFLATRDLP